MGDSTGSQGLLTRKQMLAARKWLVNYQKTQFLGSRGRHHAQKKSAGRRTKIEALKIGSVLVGVEVVVNLVVNLDRCAGRCGCDCSLDWVGDELKMNGIEAGA